MSMESIISGKTTFVNLRKLEIDKYSTLCEDKLSSLQHYANILGAFKQQFRVDAHAYKKKLNNFRIFEFSWKSRRRIILYELCTIFFNPQTIHLLNQLIRLNEEIETLNNPRAITGLWGADLTFTEKEDEISTSLGYMVLLLNCISKYAEVPLAFPMQFVGSKSLIFDLKENLQLYSFRVYERRKFKKALEHFIHNIYQILESFAVDKRYIQLNFRLLLQTLVDLLNEGYKS